MTELDSMGKWIGHRLARVLACFALVFLGCQICGEPTASLPHEENVEVPNVVGRGIDKAEHILAEFGLNLGEVVHEESEAERGTVIAQDPAPGTVVPVGTSVHLVVSSGIGDHVEVPSVLKFGIDDARHALAEAGLEVGEVAHRESEVPPGMVIAQEPAAGTAVPVGTAVHLVVSSGVEEKVEVPNVVGRGIDMAELILAEHGLKLGEIAHKESEAERGTVIAQEPAGGMFVPAGTAVHLAVSSGIADKVEVPSVLELHIETARQIIAEAGLKVGEVGHRESEAPPGTVIAQEPAAGKVVAVGTAVHLVVSSGIVDTVEVPHVVDLHIDKARDVLAEVGLKVSKVTYCPCELEPGIVLAQDPRAGTAVPVGTAVYLVVSSRSEEKVEVPNVVGRGIDQAGHILAEFGLKVGEVAHKESEAEHGTVIAQEPAAGTAVAAGSSVHLVVSLGVGDKVEVPSVLELPIDDARHIIAEAGLKVGEVSHKESEAAPGTVLVQEPAPGTLVPVGTAVHLVVSSGIEGKVEVPSVVGRGIDMAERILKEHNLRLGEVSHTESEAERGTVIAQEPAAGAAVPAGTAVHLVVSSGIGDKVEVPAVVELDVDTARHVLTEKGLKVGEVSHRESELSPGTVLAQEPKAGTLVLVGTAVHLVVSSGVGEKVEVPSVVELSLDDARHALAERGLEVGEVTHKESEATPGTVLAQEPGAGAFVQVGTAVHLVVASGTEDTEKGAAPGPLATISRVGDTISLSWMPFGNGEYVVQWTDDLATGIWWSVPRRSTTDITWSGHDINGDKQRYYRVLSE